MNAQTTTDWTTEVQRRREILLNYLLMIAALVGSLALVVNLVSVVADMGWGLQIMLQEMVPFTLVWLIIVTAWLWRGLGYRVRAWITFALAYFMSAYTFVRGGLPGSGRVWTLLPPVLAFVLLGQQAGIASGIAGILTYAAFALLISQGILEPKIDKDPFHLDTWGTEGASFLVVVTLLTLLLWIFSRNWLETLMGASKANKELEETNTQLYRQAAQLQATTEIAQAGSTILEPDALMDEIVKRVQERFSLMGVYYVGLLLVDEARQALILKAATGEAGQLLLEIDYEVPIDETTTAGWCVSREQTRVKSGLEGRVQLGPLPMPHTRSEIALPLRSRGRLIGAMCVHSTHDTAFSKEDVAALQTMADQAAVAIDNVRLFSQTEIALKEARIAQRRYLAQAWQEFLSIRPVSEVDYHQTNARTRDDHFLEEARHAATVHQRTVAMTNASRDAISSTTPQTALVVPLKLREQVIGTITLHEIQAQRAWTPEEISMAETIAEQVALTIENLRLLDSTQRRAVRELAIREIADRMQRATDMESLMRVTAEELNRTLGGSGVQVHLDTGPGSTGGNGQTGEGES